MASTEDLLKLQEAINNIVTTASSVQQANTLLNTEIEKVDDHNISPEAHEDIRQELYTIQNSIPKTLTDPIVTGPLTVENGETYSYTFTANPLLAETTINKFKLLMPPDATPVEYTEGITNNQLTIDLTFTGERFESQTLVVYAYDSNGNESSPAYVNLTITKNAAPDLTNLLCTGIPAYVNPDDVISFSFSGATDIDIPYGDTLTYEFTDYNDLVFSQTTDLVPNTTYTMTIPSGATRGTSRSFNIKVIDQKNAISTKTFTTNINRLPVTTNLITTIPALINKNSSASFRISGATDPDGNTLTYSIESSDPNISFSKTSGIAELELVSINVSDAAVVGDIISFTVNAVDQYNGTSPVTITSKVNTPPDISSLTCSLDSIVKPNTLYNFNLSGATDIDGNSMIYSLVCSDLSYVFSKKTNIAADENLTVQTPSNALRGSTFTIAVTVTDSVGATSEKVFVYTVNTLPVATESVFNLPSIIKPNTTYENINLTGVTDVDAGQTITYSIASSDANITFSKNMNIALGENIDVIVSDSIVRNTSVTFTATISDGLETITKTFTALINSLPVATGITTTIPTYIYPDHTFAFSMSGATDINNGQTLTYAIESNDANITFSKNTGITAGESINLIANSSLTRGSIPEFTITVSDGLESSTTIKTTKVNNLPSTEVTDTITDLMVPGQTYGATLSSTDIDTDQTIMYAISSNNAKVTFSKSSGIGVNESFNIIVASDITRGATVTFTITISDGVETTTTTTTTNINILPVVISEVINGLPSIIKPNTTYPLNISGATTGGDTGQTISHFIDSNDANITFSKSDNLAAGESFNMIVGTSITRNTTVSLTVITSDGLESVNKTFTTLVNALPVATGIVFSLPAIVKPSTDYTTALTGLTDANSGSQSLTYSISCNDPSVTFSKSDELTEGESFTTHIGNIARNTTLTFTVVGSDGLEMAIKNITSLINSLPIVTNVVCNGLPTSSPGGVTVPINFTGATDVNSSQALTYSISNISDGLSFSKTSGITESESVNLTITKVSVEATKSFTVTVYDALSEASGTTKTFSLTVTVIYIVGTPSITYPTEGTMVPYESFTVTLSAVDVTIDA